MSGINPWLGWSTGARIAPQLKVPVLIFSIGLLTAIAYLPSLSVPFQFDDYARISGNWNLRDGNWLRGIAQLGGSRVVPAVSLAFNYWLSGEETWTYHAGNLIVHLLACLAVWRLLWLFVQTPRIGERLAPSDRVFFVAAATAVFACHPLQTQAVTYVVQRFASMAALFYVASLGEYLAGRLLQCEGRSGRWHFVGSAVLALAALLSKENAISLPLAVVLVELAGFGKRQLGALLRFGLVASPILAIPVVWKLVAWRSRLSVEDGGGWLQQIGDSIFSQGINATSTIGPVEYFLTQMIVLPRYLWLFLVPVGLNVDHDVPVATTLSAGVVAGAVFLLMLASVAARALRRAPLFGFGLAWVFVALSVESSVVPIHDVMMEHRVYLAMPGLAVLASLALVWLRTKVGAASVGAAVAIVLVLASATFARNQVWSSAKSLWSDAAGKSPNKPRVLINVGVAHHGEGELDEAISYYCRALALDPEIPLARDNIEIALEQKGVLSDVLARLRPQRVEVPGAPAGAVVLEYDPSTVVCAEGGGQ